MQTGTGKIHLQDYAFQHKVAGQPPVVEWCMRPAPHGSHKRYHFTMSVDKPTCNADQAFADSDSYLRDFHDLLFRHALSKPYEITLDKYARGMCVAVRRAVDDVLEDPTLTVVEPTCAKLGFLSTDVFRYANEKRRWMQYLTVQKLPECRDYERTTINVHEFAMAIRAWLRQMRMHNAYHRYMASLPAASASSQGAMLATDRTWRPPCSKVGLCSIQQSPCRGKRG